MRDLKSTTNLGLTLPALHAQSSAFAEPGSSTRQPRTRAHQVAVKSAGKSPGKSPEPISRRMVGRIVDAGYICALGCVIAFSGSALHAQSAENDGAREQFAFAVKLYQSGDDKLAADSFSEFITKFPNDVRRDDAIYFRVILARKAGQLKDAQTLVNQIQRTTLVSETAVLLLRGQVAVDLKEYDRALPWLEKVDLEKATPADRAGALYLQGICYRETGNTQAAARAFEACAQIDSPLKARCLLELGLNSRAARKYEEALDVLTRALAAGDAAVAPSAGLLAGNIARVDLMKYAQAQTFYEQVIKNHQSSDEFGPAVVGSLWCHLALGENEVLLTKASRLSETLRPVDRQSLLYLSALAHQALGEQDEAVRILSDLDRQQLTQELRPLVRFYLAMGQLETADQAGFERTVKSFDTDFPDSGKANAVLMLRVQARVKAKDWAGAAAVLTGVIDQKPPAPVTDRLQALKRRAELYESANNPKAAVEDYAAWAVLFETAPKSATIDPTEPARLALRQADLFYQLGRAKEAGDVLKRVVGAANTDPMVDQEARFLLALCLAREDKPQEAADVISAFLQKYPQTKRMAEARYHRGLLLMATEKPDDALDDLLFVGAYNDMPQRQRVEALRLAGLRLRQMDKKEAAGQTLRDLRQLSELRPDEALWLAKLMIDSGQGKEAMAVLDPLIKRDVRALPEIETRAEAQYLTGIARRLAGDLDGSINILQTILSSEATPNLKLEARLELARSLADRGKTQEAIAQYEQLISARPSHIAATAAFDCATLYRAVARARRGDPASPGSPETLLQAEKLFKRVVLLYSFPQLSPLPERAWIELGELAQDQGRLDEAIKSYQSLADKYPKSSFGLYGRAMVLVLLNKNRVEAAQILRQIPQPVDPTLTVRINLRLREWEGIR